MVIWNSALKPKTERKQCLTLKITIQGWNKASFHVHSEKRYTALNSLLHNPQKLLKFVKLAAVVSDF